MSKFHFCALQVVQEIKAKVPASGGPFAMSFAGQLKISQEGEYTFCVNSSDGSRVSQ
jgi:hypothetical protein